MIHISGLNDTAFAMFSAFAIIPILAFLPILWTKKNDGERMVTKKNFKTFIVSFSLFFVLSHILSYAISYRISYLVSYVLLFIYLIITQRKNFELPSLIIYFNFFIILQAILYIIISEVRFQLDYYPTDKELDAYVSYLFLSGYLIIFLFFIGCLFYICSAIYKEITKIFKIFK